MTELEGKKLSDIQKFYVGKNIFITGGTGFLGKVLIEKLLRSCRNINNIYFLVRQKKGKDVVSRIKEICSCSLFIRLSKEYPDFKQKLIPITGDLMEPGLGISDEDKEILRNNVNVIIHSAATVKFDEHLGIAMRTNTEAPLELIELARGVKDLEAFLHVSTAYSNCNQHLIEEKIYKNDIDYVSLRERVAKISDDKVEEITPAILGDWPNTYTFTKAMAERELTKARGDLPLAFFRPSIIISTYKEPVPSWIDNLTGATGISVGVGSGVLRVMHCDKECIADLVPVDYVVNAIVAAAFDVSKLYKQSVPEDPPVYNYVSAVENPLKWGEYARINLKNIMAQPFPQDVQAWHVSMMLCHSRIITEILQFLWHTIPAFIFDLIAVVSGSKPRMRKIYQKIEKFSSVLRFFTTRSFNFENGRTRALWDKLSEDDKTIFPFSMKGLSWEEYYSNYLLGIRRYFFKVGDETMEKDLQSRKRLDVLHSVVKSIMYALGAYLLWSLLCLFF